MPEKFVRVLKEFVSTVQELLPSAEAKEFVERLVKYIENVSIELFFFVIHTVILF